MTPLRHAIIKDITGSFDIINNPGGWGEINLTSVETTLPIRDTD